MFNLLNDFREFSKIQINKNKFELNILLDEVKNILISLIDNKRIKDIKIRATDLEN